VELLTKSYFPKLKTYWIFIYWYN